MDSEAPTRKLEPGAEPTRDAGSESDGDRDAEGTEQLRRGDRLSRYVLIDRLGSGGMGVVYRAYDPELDRPVALKVLHESETGSTESARRGERLVREARVLAQLAHPNVVKVHDVDSIDGRIFIAMELIEGRTLKQWMRGRARDWRDVVALFCRAGRGLAAAHTADIVHRDFKPDNVLLGDDGGVYVVDFGLARARPGRARSAKDDALERNRRADVSDASARVLAHLTETGTVLGTPAYMAPEQHAGGSIDARADQFGFCVALYEALYGVRPFAGATVDELVSSVMRHKLQTPPRDRRVPMALRRIVERGLSLDPGDRFPSMKALLSRLEALPGRRRRRFRVAALGLALAVASAASLAYAEYRAATVCADGDLAASAAWNDARAQQIRRSFAATGRPYAGVAADRVNALLGDYASTWRTQWRESCEATHVSAEQSTERFSRRDTCLWRSLTGLDALARELSTADVEVLDHAIQAAHRLPVLARCQDPAPRGANGADDDLELRRQLATATALRDVGKLAAAARVIDDVLSAAEPASADDVRARAHLVAADIHASRSEAGLAERAYYEAIWSADEAAADEVGAAAWIDLFALVSANPDRAEEAQALAEDARSAVRRADSPARLGSALAVRLGEHARRRADLDAALRHFQHALEIRTEAYGPMHLDVATGSSQVGAVHGARGEIELAVSAQLRALAIAQDVLGPDHPATATFMTGLGDALMAQGKPEQARVYHDRARAVLRGSAQR